MNSTLTPYQFTGLQKLAAFRDHFIYDHSSTGSITTQVMEEIATQFTNVFCEYQLADTNYINNLIQSRRHHSMTDVVSELDLQGIAKYLTYIIWTDRVRPGYLESNFKDNTIFLLLSRLEELLHQFSR